MIGTISKFSPTNLYGFVQDSVNSREIFYHAQDFLRIKPGEPYPILGERVEVLDIRTGSGNCPRANQVKRLDQPILKVGIVTSFDSARGWGFVEFEPGTRAFLHRQDFAVVWMPIIGARIQFFLGYSEGRARACWANPIPL